MPRVSADTTLEPVEHILSSGIGTLDFAVQGENDYYTWEGAEDADWTIENVDRVENDNEDRFIIYPETASFTCEVESSDEGAGEKVHCWCD